ncbi:unnamed protein product [Strongylus vulgaris]|uniref:Uncharacterized protein n=1 Tax=Strongylus vulgaris TaxID=40348 RepID=A0A3P7JRE5_STRVU|nr:unnamed protein product [Strongylus vulgaris]
MDFTSHPNVTDELSYMFSVNNSFSMLKQVASAFLCRFLADESGASAPHLFAESVDLVIPTNHESDCKVKSESVKNTLCNMAYSTRPFQLSPCGRYVFYYASTDDCDCVRSLLLSAREKILQEVFKVLDRFVELGLLEADTKANNLMFR